MKYVQNKASFPISWRNSMLTEMKIWIFVLLLGLLIISNLVLRGEILPIVKEKTTAVAEQSIKNIVAEIQEKLTTAKTLAISLANLTTNLPKDKILYYSLIPDMIDVKGLDNFIAGGGVWPEPFRFDENEERSSFFWGRDNNNLLQYYDDYNDPQGSGYHHEEWYVPVKYIEKDAVYWSRSYADPYSHQSMVTVTAPIWNRGSYDGVATIDIKLDGIKALVDRYTRSLNGYGFIVDRNGKFISFPDQQIGLDLYKDNEYVTLADITKQNSAFEPYLAGLNQLTKRVIANADFRIAKMIERESEQIDIKEAILISSIYSPIIDKKNDNLHHHFDVEHDAVLKEKAHVILFEIPDTHWIMAIVTPDSLYSISVNQLSRTVTLYQVLAAVFILLIMFVVFEKMITRPFYSLISQLQKATQTNSYTTIDYSGNNEFGLLASWFNKRAKQLQQSEQELKDSGAYLQGALESANAGTLTYNLKDKILEWDERSCTIFGLDPGSFNCEYDTWRNCVHPDDITQVEKKFKQTLRNKSATEFSDEYRIIVKDDELRWVHVSLKITRNEQGYALLCRGLHLDITSKKTAALMVVAKEKAEESNRLKSEFLAKMSHELRTPMHGILSFANFGVRRVDSVSKEKLKQYFSNIQISGNRLLVLLNDLLDLSKLEAGKMVLNKKQADLSRVFDSYYQEQKQRMVDFDLTLQFNEPAQAVSGVFDVERIGQVLLNLLSNAIKFSPKDGVITVNIIETEDRQLQFSMHDQGVGIPKNEQETIFDAFIQSRNTISKEGTGLGLAISKEIIELHGGSIWVESDVGNGTTFSFRIPAQDEM